MKFRIREVRKAKGISQGYICHVTGICRGTLSRLERNQAKDPRISTLCGIAEVLGVSVSSLLVEDWEIQKDGRRYNYNGICFPRGG